MKKYPRRYDKALTIGLRPDSRMRRGADAMEACVDLKPTPHGLVRTDDLTSPYSEVITNTTQSSLHHIVDIVNATSRASDADWTLESQWAYDAGNTEMDRTPGTGAPILSGDELLANGTFTGAATSWTLTNWAYSANQVNANTNATATCAQNATQGTPPAAGVDCYVQFELVNQQPSGTYEFAGSSTFHVNFGGVTGASYTTLGAKAETLAYGTGVLECVAQGGGGSNYCRIGLDNVSIQEITGYSAVGADTLRLADANLDEVLVAGRTYYLNFTVDNYAAGSVTPDLGGTNGTARSADGTYFEAIVAGSGGTGLTFEASTDFNGTVDISDVHIYYFADLEWPWPQLFRGREVTLIAWKQHLATVDETTWYNTNLTVYDASSTATEDTITNATGGAWHFCDFGTTWALFNGVEVVYYDPGTSKYLVWDDTTIKTGCNFRGRAVMAGFSDWPAVWKTAYQKLAEDDSSISHTMTLGDNWILISPPGDGGIASPWWLNDALSGTITTSGRDATYYEQVRQYFLRNDWFMAPLPFQGNVLRVEPLGKGLMVYGEDGVCVLYPAVIGDTATFGLKTFRELRSVGIAGRSAIAIAGGDGSDDSGEHVFIDTKGNWWRVGVDLQPQRLGYSEFGSALSTYPVGSYHIAEDEDEFLMCDGTDGYVLTRSGLCKQEQGFVSSIITDGSGNTYATINPDETITGLASFLTHPEDFALPGMKSVNMLMCLHTGLTDAQCRVYYRYLDADAATETWTATDWIDLDHAGVAFPRITANEFKFEVRGTPETDARVYSLIVEWELEDKRFIRSFMLGSQTPEA